MIYRAQKTLGKLSLSNVTCDDNLINQSISQSVNLQPRSARDAIKQLDVVGQEKFTVYGFVGEVILCLSKIYLSPRADK